MNLSHVITEFSFGPYFPDITQPLDNSFEVTQDRELYLAPFREIVIDTLNQILPPINTSYMSFRQPISLLVVTLYEPTSIALRTTLEPFNIIKEHPESSSSSIWIL